MYCAPIKFQRRRVEGFWKGWLWTVHRLCFWGNSLSQKCWVMHHLWVPADTHTHTGRCTQTFESALPCSVYQKKAPQVISPGEKNEDSNANLLNMILHTGCTTCLRIKDILLKRRSLTYGRGEESQLYLVGFSCLSYSSVVAFFKRWPWDDPCDE